MKAAVFASALALTAVPVFAAPVTYKIDSNHTYPSFVTDHLGGVSKWRGKLNKTEGNIVLDREAQTGTVEIVSDASSIDFGNDKLNAHAMSADMLDVAKYPQIIYKGRLVEFKDGAPTKVDGQLTLHGVTKPVTLTINEFMCKPHPVSKKELCGADASATIDRSAFGINFGEKMGFKMDTLLEIQVEAKPE
jgi:polyisoprenoid-binding protein YceI